VAWWSLLAPANTPKPIVAKLQQAAAKALQSQEVKDRFAIAMATPIGNSSEDFGKFMKNEVETYVRVVKQANIKLD
jgi:tripartite-type tricarboxylate transporter receptor subunit TctC